MSCSPVWSWSLCTCVSADGLSPSPLLFPWDFLFSNSLPLVTLCSPPPRLLSWSPPRPLLDVFCISSLCCYHFAPSPPSLSCVIGCSLSLHCHRTFSSLFCLPFVLPPTQLLSYLLCQAFAFILARFLGFFSCLLSLFVPPRQLSSVTATEVSPLGPCPACISCLNSCSSILSTSDWELFLFFLIYSKLFCVK